VPVAAALIAKGVSPGAALVFLMTGPATNAASLATIWRVMGRRTAVIYLVCVAVSALATGTVLDWLYQWPGPAAEAGMGWMMPEPVKTLAVVALLAVLAYAVVAPPLKRLRHGPAGAPSMFQMKVTGMTCSHCVAAVKQALMGCKGVTAVEVELAGGNVRVDGTAIDANTLVASVRAAGYEVQQAGRVGRSVRDEPRRDEVK
jgi:hypothetical protein